MRSHHSLAVLLLSVWVGRPSLAVADSPGGVSLDDSTLFALAVALGEAPPPDLGDPGPAVASTSVIQLVARVHARSLVFTEVPRVRVAFGGGQRTVPLPAIPAGAVVNPGGVAVPGAEAAGAPAALEPVPALLPAPPAVGLPPPPPPPPPAPPSSDDEADGEDARGTTTSG